MKRAGIGKVLLVVLIAAVVPACGDSPTRPDIGPVIDPVQAPATVTANLEITGPDIVPLGETVQFTLTLRSTGGSQRDVTNDATWSPGWGSTVSVDGPGKVTGRERGPGSLAVRYDSLSASHVLTVLPAGTFRLVGQVHEAGESSGPVTGALVEVRRGVGKGQTAYTDAFGYYWLYGVAGEIDLYVVRNGYRPVVHTVVVSDHEQGPDIELSLLAPRQEVAGTYTMTIAAADQCRDRLPAEALTRTYTATIVQDGPSLDVSLGGATFLPFQDRFPGRVEPGRVVFDSTWYDGEGPYVVEKVAALGLVVIDGIAVVTGSGDRFVGTLSGNFRIFNSDSIRPSQEPSAYCFSSHRFTLTR